MPTSVEVVPTPTTGRTFRFPRWLPVAVALALLTPIGVATFVWHANTKQLEVTQTVGPVAPGEVAMVAVSQINGCVPSYDRLYRRVAGRWLQTHWLDDADGSWVPAAGYDLWGWPKTREEFSDLRCPIGGDGFVSIMAPPDAKSSPLLACTFGDDACVLIEVRL